MTDLDAKKAALDNVYRRLANKPATGYIYCPYIPLYITPPLTRWKAFWLRFRYLLWTPARKIRMAIDDRRYSRRRFVVYDRPPG